MTTPHRRPSFDRRGRQGPPADHRRPPEGRPGGPVARPAGALPAGYLEGGYFDAKDNVRTEVVQEWAAEKARELATRMEVSQIRRFFGEVRRLERMIQGDDDFQALRARVKRLVSIAAYTVGRREAGRVVAPEEFKTFMEQNVELAIKSYEAFKAFVLHFESVVGYLVFERWQTEQRRRSQREEARTRRA